MKFLTFFTVFLYTLIIYSCGKNQPEAVEKSATNTDKQVSLISSSLPQFSNEYLVGIYEKQELIKISEDNPELRKKYCESAYNPESKLLVTMGIGSLKHPVTGNPISRTQAERAAMLDAYRWVGYGETWLNNEYQPAFGKLQTYVKRRGTVVNQSVVGDSLFVFIATEIEVK